MTSTTAATGLPVPDHAGFADPASRRPAAGAPPARLPDTEALRRAALQASWARDRVVGQRRLRLRWLNWVLLRVVLPLSLAGAAALAWWLFAPLDEVELPSVTTPAPPEPQRANTAAQVAAPAVPAPPPAVVTGTSAPASLAPSDSTPEVSAPITAATGTLPASTAAALSVTTIADPPAAGTPPGNSAPKPPALRLDLGTSPGAFPPSPSNPSGDPRP